MIIGSKERDESNYCCITLLPRTHRQNIYATGNYLALLAIKHLFCFSMQLLQLRSPFRISHFVHYWQMTSQNRCFDRVLYKIHLEILTLKYVLFPLLYLHCIIWRYECFDLDKMWHYLTSCCLHQPSFGLPKTRSPAILCSLYMYVSRYIIHWYLFYVAG